MERNQGGLYFISDSGQTASKGKIVLETSVPVEGSNVLMERHHRIICTMDNVVAWVNDMDSLSCKNIGCHAKRDIVETLYGALEVLPCCQSRSIMSAALQEIQALRALTA